VVFIDSVHINHGSMSKLISIISGWGKYITGQIPQYAIDRAKICADCPYAIKGRFEMILKDTELKEIQGLKCDKCSCPIVTKIRSEQEECPLKKW
jgi:hypothetical protein